MAHELIPNSEYLGVVPGLLHHGRIVGPRHFMGAGICCPFFPLGLVRFSGKTTPGSCWKVWLGVRAGAAKEEGWSVDL